MNQPKPIDVVLFLMLIAAGAAVGSIIEDERRFKMHQEWAAKDAEKIRKAEQWSELERRVEQEAIEGLLAHEPRQAKERCGELPDRLPVVATPTAIPVAVPVCVPVYGAPYAVVV